MRTRHGGLKLISSLVHALGETKFNMLFYLSTHCKWYLILHHLLFAAADMNVTTAVMEVTTLSVEQIAEAEAAAAQAKAMQQAYMLAMLAYKKEVDTWVDRSGYTVVIGGVICLPLVLVGSLLTIKIVQTGILRNTSSATYLTALALIDVIFMFVGYLPDAIFIAMRDKMGQDGGVWLCKIWTFFHRTGLANTSWILLAAALDAAYQIQKKTKSTVGKARVVVAIILICVIALNFWVFWGIGKTPPIAVSTTIQMEHCGYTSKGFSDYDIKYNQYITLVAFSVLPAFGNLLTMIVTILGLLKLSKDPVYSTENEIERMRYKTAGTMMIWISFTFIFMGAPYIAMGAIFYDEVFEPYRAKQDFLGLVHRTMAKAVLIVVGALFHHSMKFYFFCMVSSGFRSDVKGLCGKNGDSDLMKQSLAPSPKINPKSKVENEENEENDKRAEENNVENSASVENGKEKV